jgi:hypothetical protein
MHLKEGPGEVQRSRGGLHDSELAVQWMSVLPSEVRQVLGEVIRMPSQSRSRSSRPAAGREGRKYKWKRRTLTEAVMRAAHHTPHTHTQLAVLTALACSLSVLASQHRPGTGRSRLSTR